MARRKQLGGTAENLAQWVVSRNFDCQGYWAPGKFYEFVEAKANKTMVIDLMNSALDPIPGDDKYDVAIKELSSVLTNNLKSNGIPESWLKEVKVVLQFEAKYEHELHYFGSKLGGKPFICTVSIATDLSKIYSASNGCNVWVHNPKREQRRSTQ